MKAALCTNINLFMDIRYYVCSLESITPPVKLLVMTLNVLVIVRESCHQLCNHWPIWQLSSIVAHDCNNKQHIVCGFDSWKIILCRILALELWCYQSWTLCTLHSPLGEQSTWKKVVMMYYSSQALNPAGPLAQSDRYMLCRMYNSTA